MAASYVISVRQASALPAASFRFHLAMDTLAVRLTVPLTEPVGDLTSADLGRSLTPQCYMTQAEACGYFMEVG